MRPSHAAVFALALAVVAGCRRPAPPPPVNDAGAPPAVPVADAGEVASADGGPGDAGTAVAIPSPQGAPTEPARPEGEWRPPLSKEELKALDRYAAFSRDGLLFAYTEFSSGAGVPVLSFQSSTTNTIEKTVALPGDEAKQKVAEELAEEGFAKPGATPAPPPIVGTQLQEGQIIVTFSGMPAAAPFKPFASTGGVKPASAEVVAVTRDGKRAAVRAVGSSAVGEFGKPVEYRIVTLFEQ